LIIESAKSIVNWKKKVHFFIILPPGNHNVYFRYMTPYLKEGLFLGLFGLLLYAGMIVLSRLSNSGICKKTLDKIL
jgi:hypothetical protein